MQLGIRVGIVLGHLGSREVGWMCIQSIGYAWMCWQSSVWDVHSASFRSTAYAGFRRKDVRVCAREGVRKVCEGSCG